MIPRQKSIKIPTNMNTFTNSNKIQYHCTPIEHDNEYSFGTSPSTSSECEDTYFYIEHESEQKPKEESMQGIEKKSSTKQGSQRKRTVSFDLSKNRVQFLPSMKAIKSTIKTREQEHVVDHSSFSMLSLKSSPTPLIPLPASMPKCSSLKNGSSVH